VRLCGALQQKHQVLSMIRERMTVAKTECGQTEKAGKNEGGRVVPAAAFSLE
jgi:hypothetical protein